MGPIFAFALPISLVLAVGLVGSTRRLGFWVTVLLSVVLTPIGGFIVALLSGPRRHHMNTKLETGLDAGLDVPAEAS